MGDEGLYECVAENPVGRVSMDARVSVHKTNKAPTFTTPLQDVTADLGKNVTLTCHVTGTPTPSVFWRRNGLMVADTLDFLQSLTRGLARLDIRGLREKHVGQYECVAKNEAGDATCSCQVKVNMPPATEQQKQQETPPLPVTSRRTFKKLSEPHPSDVISAVLMAGRKVGVQRTQSFSPRSASVQAPSPSGPLRAVSVQEGEKGVASKDSEQRAVNRYTVQWTDSGGQVSLDSGVGPPELSPPSSGRSPFQSPRDTASTSSSSSSPSPSSSLGLSTSSQPLSQGPPDSAKVPVPFRTQSSVPGTASPSMERKFSEPPKPSPAKPSQSPRSVVSQLRAQFTKLDEGAGAGGGGGGGGVRRWHSMPLNQERPTVVKRGPSQLAADDRGPAATTTAVVSHSTPTAIMSTTTNYDNINDEEELHKLMNATDNFDERKKIRARLKEIREKQREEMEARRRQREKETEDLVRRKFALAEEEKKRKMEAYHSQKATCERGSDYASTSQKLITDKHRLAEEEKQKRLEAYKNIASKEHQRDDGKTSVKTVTTTSKAPDGSTTMTKKTETTTAVKQTPGFGGVQYGAGPELNTRSLKEQLSGVSGPGSSGSITIKTESWSSRDGIVHKAQKTESWGAKPQGPRGAMAAFKQMDAANPSAKPTNKPAMARSPSAIKQVLLDWCKAMTREYENVEVTNFSSSWNNGLAFCALIHHFFPDAFDYSQLDAKNRRHNFDLAFDTAEKLADIAPLLDTDDMVKMKNPDWKCVFTYVQSIYRHLRDHENNKAKAPAES